MIFFVRVMGDMFLFTISDITEIKNMHHQNQPELRINEILDRQKWRERFIDKRPCNMMMTTHLWTTLHKILCYLIAAIFFLFN